jgi:hypothetical protein
MVCVQMCDVMKYRIHLGPANGHNGHEHPPPFQHRLCHRAQEGTLTSCSRAVQLRAVCAFDNHCSSSSSSSSTAPTLDENEPYSRPA